MAPGAKVMRTARLRSARTAASSLSSYDQSGACNSTKRGVAPESVQSGPSFS